MSPRVLPPRHFHPSIAAVFKVRIIPMCWGRCGPVRASAIAGRPRTTVTLHCDAANNSGKLSTPPPSIIDPPKKKLRSKRFSPMCHAFRAVGVGLQQRDSVTAGESSLIERFRVRRVSDVAWRRLGIAFLMDPHMSAMVATVVLDPCTSAGDVETTPWFLAFRASAIRHVASNCTNSDGRRVSGKSCKRPGAALRLSLGTATLVARS